MIHAAAVSNPAGTGGDQTTGKGARGLMPALTGGAAAAGPLPTS
jgi:hypothetical protein